MASSSSVAASSAASSSASNWGAGAAVFGALGGAYTQAGAQQMQGDYQQMQAETNARLSEMQAADALKRGDETASELRKKAKQVQGAQRASFAAQGISLDKGSALQLQEETDKLSELDSMTIRNNAWREAWGYKFNAANGRASGAFAASAGRYSANSTLLAGGLQAANDYIKAKKG